MNVAIITARGGSKGLPRKNILDLAGAPLIGWTIRAALDANCIDAVYVTTEDDEIASVSKSLGASIIPRPYALAQDDTSSEPVIEHAIEYLKENNITVQNVCLLQPTSPLRNGDHIDQAWEAYQSSESKCVISVFEPKHSPAKAYKILPNGEIVGLLHESAPYMRRQDLDTCVQPNGAIYLFSAKDFLKSKCIPRDQVFPLLMSESDSVDIDTKEDLDLAEKLLEKRNAS